MQAKTHFITKVYLKILGHLEMLSAKPWVGTCQSLDLQENKVFCQLRIQLCFGLASHQTLLGNSIQI
jgi:hypothetical protein